MLLLSLFTSYILYITYYSLLACAIILTWHKSFIAHLTWYQSEGFVSEVFAILSSSVLFHYRYAAYKIIATMDKPMFTWFSRSQVAFSNPPKSIVIKTSPPLRVTLFFGDKIQTPHALRAAKSQLTRLWASDQIIEHTIRKIMPRSIKPRWFHINWTSDAPPKILGVCLHAPHRVPTSSLHHVPPSRSSMSTYHIIICHWPPRHMTCHRVHLWLPRQSLTLTKPLTIT